jgi:hypothetical protein
MSALLLGRLRLARSSILKGGPTLNPWGDDGTGVNEGDEVVGDIGGGVFQATHVAVITALTKEV